MGIEIIKNLLVVRQENAFPNWVEDIRTAYGSCTTLYSELIAAESSDWILERAVYHKRPDSYDLKKIKKFEELLRINGKRLSVLLPNLTQLTQSAMINAGFSLPSKIRGRQAGPIYTNEALCYLTREKKLIRVPEVEKKGALGRLQGKIQGYSSYKLLFSQAKEGPVEDWCYTDTIVEDLISFFPQREVSYIKYGNCEEFQQKAKGD